MARGGVVVFCSLLDRRSEWVSPDGKTLNVVACHQSQILCAAGRDLYYLEIEDGRRVHLVTWVPSFFSLAFCSFGCSFPVSVGDSQITDLVLLVRFSFFVFEVFQQRFNVKDPFTALVSLGLKPLSAQSSRHTTLEYEVACLDLTPIAAVQEPGQALRSDLCAIGLWTDISARLLQLPDLREVHKEPLGGGLSAQIFFFKIVHLQPLS